MSEMVEERLASEKVERHDLFSSLLASNSPEFDASTLTEEELIGVLPLIVRYSFVYTISGNIFAFLVAGHEVRFKINFLLIIPMVYVIKTTAHTLCFAFALLALYHEEQETLYQHIKSVLPGDKQPVSCEHNTKNVQYRRCLTGV